MGEISSVSGISVGDTNIQRLQNVSSKAPQDIEEVKKLSREFESIFMEIVLKSMRETIEKSKFIDGGNGEQIFQSMLDSEYAKNLANQNMTGLSSSIEGHLTRLMHGTSAIDEARKVAGRAQYLKQNNDQR